MNASHRQPIPEPTIGSTIRTCWVYASDRQAAPPSLPCQVVGRIGPNTFRLRRELASDGANWVERVTSWVNAPQAKEVAS